MLDDKDSSEAIEGDADKGTRPHVIRNRKLSLPRVLLLLVLLVAVSAGFYFALSSSTGQSEPSLESQLQSQSENLSRAQFDIQSLTTDRDEARARLSALSQRADDLMSRLQAIETTQQAAQDLPGQVEALSNRVQRLSDSVDVRFSATQEKQQTLESQIEQARKQRVSRTPASSRQKPSPPPPAFNVTGLEQRGGRPYLVVALGKSTRLSDLRLIGEGQSIGGWQLSSIDGRSAAFVVGGQTVVLPIP